jgi:hypothetical protein
VTADPSRAESLAEKLLEAQVAWHLGQLSEDALPETVARLAEDLLAGPGARPIADLVDRDVAVAILARTLQSVPRSPAVGAVLEVATQVVHDGPVDGPRLGELVAREQVEALLDELLALSPALERGLERLTASPLVGTVASRFMGRIVGEVLQANRAVADRVPGLGSLMSFGTSAASKVMGVADKQFEGLIGDTVGKGGTFAVRRLNRILVETVQDPTTREAVLQVWDLAAREQVSTLSRSVTHEQLTGLVEAVHEAVATAVSGEPATLLVEVMVDALLERFGGHTPAELLDELGLDRADVVADVARVAPAVVGALRGSGELERLLRSRLAPFYASAEVSSLLV